MNFNYILFILHCFPKDLLVLACNSRGVTNSQSWFYSDKQPARELFSHQFSELRSRSLLGAVLQSTWGNGGHTSRSSASPVLTQPEPALVPNNHAPPPPVLSDHHHIWSPKSWTKLTQWAFCGYFWTFYTGNRSLQVFWVLFHSH